MKKKAGPGTFSLPPISSLVTKNGLKLFAVRRTELPLVSLHLILPRGAETDPAGKGGLSDLTAEMLTLGTQKRSATQLAAEIDGLGATLSAHSGWDFTSIQIFGLSEDLEYLLDLLLEIYTLPAFSREEFDQMKQRRIASLVQQKDESEIIADERFQEILFSGTAYDHPVYGTLESLPGLSCEESEDHYRRGILPEGTFLVAAGDLDPEGCSRWIEANFPAVGREQCAGPRGLIPHPLSAIRIVLVDRPDLTQSQIRLGHIGIPHADPGYVPFEVMNYILGAGGFSSRLMKRIRSELGYTYGIRGSLEPRKNPGPYTISTFTPTETTFPCVEEIFSVLRSFISQGATDPEREEAINFLTGSYPMRFETLSQIAQRIIQAELHGLELDFLSSYPQKVSAVTLEGIGDSARKHLNLERMLLVIVGQMEKFRPQFESLGPVEIGK